MTITTDEAAEEFGVAPSTIRMWVLRGHLEPVRRGAKPLRFRVEDVWRAAARLRPAADQERLRALSERWSDTP